MGSGRARRRRVLRAVVLAVVAVNLAVGLLVSVLALRHDADGERQTRIALAEVDRDAAELAHEIAECADPADPDSACRSESSAAVKDLEEAFEAVRDLIDEPARLDALGKQVHGRPPIVIGVTDRTWVENDDAVDAWLTRVHQEVARLSGQEAASASRNSMSADLETVLLMVTALAVAITLFHGFDSARREAALRALRERERSEARFKALVTHASDLILVMDENLALRYHTPSAGRLLELEIAPDVTPDAGPDVTHLLMPEEQPEFQAAVDSLLSGERGAIRHTAAWRGRDGAVVWLECTLTDLRAAPDIGGIVLNGHDITEARALEDQLRHQAFTDTLSGLANRALFSDRLEQALKLRRRIDRVPALLYLDLDGFKQVNDSNGHPAGDELLQRVALCLQDATRSGDTVARLGGDEFAVLIAAAETHALAATAERLLAAVRRAGARASVGVATADEFVLSAEDLVRRADLAMYAAKGRGGDSVVVFEAHLHSTALQRAQLRGDLARAVHNEELRLLYQPVIDVHTGRVVGFEALLRWDHPERGVVSPVVFVPAAEETQDIVAFGRWVLRTACRQARAWDRQFAVPDQEPLHLSVNVSVAQLRDPDLVADVKAALDDAGLPPTSLTLEITESQFIEDPFTTDVLRQLRDVIGVTVALDDFGTGYSSLSYLERLPVDILKIDQSFVQRVTESEQSRVLVGSIVAMAHGLGLQLVAEGVEREEQAAVLRELGCRRAQGFLWARPLTPEAIEHRLREERSAVI